MILPHFRSVGDFPGLSNSRSGYAFTNASSRMRSWFPAMMILYLWGWAFSQSSWAWISSKSPYCERSPACRRMSPSGSVGVALCVSEMQIIEIVLRVSGDVGLGRVDHERSFFAMDCDRLCFLWVGDDTNGLLITSGLAGVLDVIAIETGRERRVGCWGWVEVEVELQYSR